jgi:hypothetical protein
MIPDDEPRYRASPEEARAYEQAVLTEALGQLPSSRWSAGPCTTRAGSTAAFPRIQERHRVRSRPGGRPELVQRGCVAKARRDARWQAEAGAASVPLCWAYSRQFGGIGAHPVPCPGWEAK